MFKERYKIEMTKRIETRFEVQTFIDQLKYALVVQKATLKFQRNRRVDDNRHIKYTNAYTVETLFPDDDILNTLKKVLLTLKVTNYIQISMKCVYSESVMEMKKSILSYVLSY